MRNTRLSSSAILALAAMAGIGGLTAGPEVQARGSFDRATQSDTGAKQKPGDRQGGSPTDTKTDRLRVGGERNPYRRGRRQGPGWSNRHVQRMAVKARNVKRNKARR